MSKNINHLSHIQIAGSPFDAGRALGRFGAARAHAHLLNTTAWATLMPWRGTERAQRMATLTRERFPRVWTELEGLAAGLQLPLDDVFLWNARGDLWAMAPDGCTTVQVPGSHTRRITHNEDGDPGFAGSCAIGEFSVEGEPDFASFVYPASLPGHSIGVSDGGLAMTVNNLRSLNVDVGVPRMVLTRAMLTAASLDDALAILRDSPRAGGYHLSLAHRQSDTLLSVEFNAYDCSVLTLDAPSMHANHAIHPAMRDLPQLITGSSGHRQRRGDALLAAANAAQTAVDPLAILADQHIPQFPIRREDPRDSDDENTLATADIVVSPDGIDWRVYEHPASGPRFQFRDGHRVIQDSDDG